MKKKPTLSVLFATPECAPWAKTGGLGEVSAGLPPALYELGVDIRVLIPGYPSVLDQANGLHRIATLPPEFGFPEAAILRGRLPTGLPALVLDCPPLYARPAGGPYLDERGLDYADNALRFGLLSRVAARLASMESPLGWFPDLLHCNDWTTGLAPAYLKSGLERPAPSLMVIHNLAFQGVFPLDIAPELGLPPAVVEAEGFAHWGRLSFLRAGLYCTDHIVTVSPTYAQEILGERLGCGLDELLRTRRDRLSGILNGIDTAIWDPRADPFVDRHYDGDTLEEKRINKRALQVELKLAEDDRMLLLGMVSRLTDQKGVDLVIDALPALFERPVQVVVLGTGEDKFERSLRDAEGRWPTRMATVIGFDETLAHRIEAAADAFLMPSLFEPCGLNQMYSQRYGTPPIVRATGGLVDSVGDYSPEGLRDGGSTGFVFADPTATALIETVDRALQAWSDPHAWQQLCLNGMARDFSWGASARAYIKLYEELCKRDEIEAVAPGEPQE
ncbi:MAG TPA: glycogen synthase GlgA [Aromatoleum sp.]|uniref:glycogen synthase GlgA n=1 Tax=Aromatoleum sp. TaxID=2307007 RepID=UPI002B46B499|nr:glycogen synthase GlgA [Aromatoleum sp.]HJV24645.1 glycogen synthase GlgA [Aromatoleum sp.]